MADGGYTILHRKDERGVIVESKAVGPDDEIPEGFGPAEYQPVNVPREDDAPPVAESKLTPWPTRGAAAEETATVAEAADEVEVPPQGGPGSGKDVWAAYAAAHGVEVESDATRDEIIAACEAAGVPVD